MDTSPEYIKMCEKATEIQEIQPAPHYSKESFYQYDKDDISIRIWLPRQDQLQEMLLEKGFSRYGNHFGLIKAFADATYAADNHYYYPSIFTTLEQLWLAFVMEKKYNKKWTGEGWQQ